VGLDLSASSRRAHPSVAAFSHGDGVWVFAETPEADRGLSAMKELR